MIGLYYRIWVDCITKASQQAGNKQNWPVITMVTMTMAMNFNLVLFMTVLQKHILHNYFYHFDLSFLPTYISKLFSYVVLYILPCIAINYLLIFRHRRYEDLLKQYPNSNGKLFLIYFLISMLLPIILLWVGIIFFG